MTKALLFSTEVHEGGPFPGVMYFLSIYSPSADYLPIMEGLGNPSLISHIFSRKTPDTRYRVHAGAGPPTAPDVRRGGDRRRARCWLIQRPPPLPPLLEPCFITQCDNHFVVWT